MKITRMAKGEWSKIRAFFDLETEPKETDDLPF